MSNLVPVDCERTLLPPGVIRIKTIRLRICMFRCACACMVVYIGQLQFSQLYQQVMYDIRGSFFLSPQELPLFRGFSPVRLSPLIGLRFCKLILGNKLVTTMSFSKCTQMVTFNVSHDTVEWFLKQTGRQLVRANPVAYPVPFGRVRIIPSPFQ